MTTKRLKAYNLGFQKGKLEDVKKIMKVIDDCADKTDIWDNERWNKFRRLVKQQLQKEIGGNEK